MTGPSLSATPDSVAGSLLSDEAALERLFRSHFPALCEEARGHLGETAASAAPRVVESAFRSAWEERAQIKSEADLDAFLHDCVRSSAARELSRRAAAHHLGGSGAASHHAASTAPDVDQAWEHLTRRLHPEATRAEAQAYTERLRHEAAEHVGDLSKPMSWKVPVTIGIVGAALAGGIMWYVTRLGADRAITRALASSEARTLTAAPGQTGTLTLADSTRVTLAAGSRLIIPQRFSGEEMRAVKVDGAARIAVAPGQAAPFEIRVGNAAVTVTGTTVTVRSYPNDPAATVQVREGQATVKVGEQMKPLTDGQAVTVDGETIREPTPAELAAAVSWADRRITVANRQLRHAVEELNRLYGIDIKVAELKLLDRPTSIDAPLDSMKVAIAQVEQTAGVEFGYEGQNMVFRTRKDTAAAAGKKRP